MLTILHGEYTQSAYQALSVIKQTHSGKEVVSLDGEKITKADLELAILGNTLFSTERLIVISGLLSSHPSKKKDDLIDYLSQNTFDPDIVLYEEKEISKTLLKKFTASQIQNFAPPESIFKFVDSLNPISKRTSILLYHEILKSEPPEIIFTMIIRQFRYMIWLKEGDNQYTKAIPSWMASKFRRQAQYFSMDELIGNYRKLLDIDYKIKFGLSPLPLPKSLDIFLLTL